MGENSMKKLKTVVVYCLCLCVGGAAWAGFSWNPGDPGTTSQTWTFSSNNPNTAADTGYYNPYGTPTAAITAQQGNNNPFWLGWNAERFNRSGVWCGDPLVITLTIPNTPNTGGYKELWLEVGYAGVPVNGTPSLKADGIITEIGRTDVDYSGNSLDTDPWRTLSVGWTIVPNPQSEALTLSFVGTGGYVDYIKVDTLCAVPAPGAIVLGGIGIACVTWLRRRRVL
jgi:hypothetical protein